MYQNLADGTTSLPHASQDLYIIQRNGSPGLVLVLNDNPNSWNGVAVNTKWANTKMQDARRTPGTAARSPRTSGQTAAAASTSGRLFSIENAGWRI